MPFAFAPFKQRYCTPAKTYFILLVIFHSLHDESNPEGLPLMLIKLWITDETNCIHVHDHSHLKLNCAELGAGCQDVCLGKPTSAMSSQIGSSVFNYLSIFIKKSIPNSEIRGSDVAQHRQTVCQSKFNTLTDSTCCIKAHSIPSQYAPLSSSFSKLFLPSDTVLLQCPSAVKGRVTWRRGFTAVNGSRTAVISVQVPQKNPKRKIRGRSGMKGKGNHVCVHHSHSRGTHFRNPDVNATNFQSALIRLVGKINQSWISLRGEWKGKHISEKQRQT